MARVRRFGPPQAFAEEPITITSVPASPYIEERRNGNAISVDLILHNVGMRALRLIAIREAVFDRRNQLEVKREVNGNGSPSALSGLGDLVLAPGEYKDVFLPFEHYAADLDLARVRLTFLFQAPERAVPAIALTADVVASLEIQPKNYHPSPYCLPLADTILVHEGHDLASHHRRRRLEPSANSSIRNVNANLYAYDFVQVDKDGELFKGSPRQKEHWLTFGAAILAPTLGRVIEAVDGIPDNSFEDDGLAVTPKAAQKTDPLGLGNHVLIKAPDGRVSWLLHMEEGSVAVRTGQQVKPGVEVGRVGFSGDSLFPHLHYTVTQGSSYPSQGVPSYFSDFHRILGHRRVAVTYGQIDTGDILRRDRKQTCGM